MVEHIKIIIPIISLCREIPRLMVRRIMKAIKGGFLIDANGVRQKPVVLFEGERIVEVGSTGSVSIPSDAEVIDARDFFLMPGLVDCHVHFTGSDVGGPINFRESYENRLIRAAVHQTKQLLDAGFTSVMDAGGLIGLNVRNAVNEGIVSGPRVMATGRYISVTGGHGDTHYLPLEWVKEGRPFGWGMDGRIADGVDECIRAVKEQLRDGVDFIKICTSGGGGSLRDPPHIPEYTPEELEVMVRIAHSWGRRVMVHCYNPEGIKRSVTAGADIVAHGNMADEDSIRLMKEHGTVVVPTISLPQDGAAQSSGGLPATFTRQGQEHVLDPLRGRQTAPRWGAYSRSWDGYHGRHPTLRRERPRAGALRRKGRSKSTRGNQDRHFEWRKGHGARGQPRDARSRKAGGHNSRRREPIREHH